MPDVSMISYIVLPSRGHELVAINDLTLEEAREAINLLGQEINTLRHHYDQSRSMYRTLLDARSKQIDHQPKQVWPWFTRGGI